MEPDKASALQELAYFNLRQILQLLIWEGDGWHADTFVFLLVYLVGFRYFSGQLISTLYSFFFLLSCFFESVVHLQSRAPVQKSVVLCTSSRISMHIPEVHCSMCVCTKHCWHRGYDATANQRKTREMTEAFLMAQYEEDTRVSAPSIALY